MEPSDPSGRPKTCVVVSYWTGRSAHNLHRLLTQMRKVDAGSRFDVLVVFNGGLERPLSLPPRFDDLRPRVLNRENHGNNLGAWDYGWRSAEEYEYSLFLQDDCFLKRPGRVGDFEFRMARDAGVGLLGEAVMWDRMTWSFSGKRPTVTSGGSPGPRTSPSIPSTPTRRSSRNTAFPAARSALT
ncbi:MAG: hypothetical protein JOZ53_08015, partial [Planctomycetaceae bacterium]|nr:hypothetical protein [Planctomycetaceae bacterium]